jgi:hypothetical protein
MQARYAIKACDGCDNSEAWYVAVEGALLAWR